MHQLALVEEHEGPDPGNPLASARVSKRNEFQFTRGGPNPPCRRSLVASIASFLSHDIRHHLAVVYCNAEFMSEPKTLETDRKQLLEEIKLAIKNITQILDFTLLHARSELPAQGGIESFSDLITSTVDAVRPHPHAAGVSISIAESSSTWAVFNRTMVSSAVYNMLLNACFAAQRGSEQAKVEIALREDHESVHILVKDNGSGVPAGFRQDLFEPFVTSDKQGGLGLGLTIAEYVARAYGGSLQLESSRPGCTIFALRLAKAVLAVLEPAPRPRSIAKTTNRRSRSYVSSRPGGHKPIPGISTAGIRWS
jgi:C4-dicarboxylate-specific signal transduction histidine kinase